MEGAGLATLKSSAKNQDRTGAWPVTAGTVHQLLAVTILSLAPSPEPVA